MNKISNTQEKYITYILQRIINSFKIRTTINIKNIYLMLNKLFSDITNMHVYKRALSKYFEQIIDIIWNSLLEKLQNDAKDINNLIDNEFDILEKIYSFDDSIKLSSAKCSSLLTFNSNNYSCNYHIIISRFLLFIMNIHENRNFALETNLYETLCKITLFNMLTDKDILQLSKKYEKEVYQIDIDNIGFFFFFFFFFIFTFFDLVTKKFFWKTLLVLIFTSSYMKFEVTQVNLPISIQSKKTHMLWKKEYFDHGLFV